MSASKKEQRRLTVHPHLIYDVITMQAGTLSKAIQEGVQNTFDAGATRCDVRLTSAQFTVTDDGKGFGSREEVEQFFEVFGLPHEPTSGTQRFARFRMGRGQIFSFARTTYESDRFTMAVDIKNSGLDYELSEYRVGSHNHCAYSPRSGQLDGVLRHEIR